MGKGKLVSQLTGGNEEGQESSGGEGRQARREGKENK